MRGWSLCAAAISSLLFSLALSVAAYTQAGRVRASDSTEERVPLSQALKELETRTGVHVGSALKSDPPITLSPVTVGFWQALDAIANQAKARVSLYQREGQLALIEAPPDYQPQPMSYDGLFRIAVRRITASQDFETGTRRYLANLELAWQPDYRPLYVEMHSQSLSVEDDQGRSLSVPNEGGGRAAVQQPRAAELEVALPAIPRAVKRIGRLNGNLSVIGAATMLRFDFDRLDTAEAQHGDVKVKLRKVTTKGDPWTVQVELLYPSGGPRFESYQSWLLHNQIFLVNKDGKRNLPSTGHSIEELKNDWAVVTYYFSETKDRARGIPGEWKVEYWTPSRLVQTAVSFEFKDLPLP